MTEDDEMFLSLAELVEKSLKIEKVFTPNLSRYVDVLQAKKIAEELFSDMTITVKPDSLQLGALILSINGFDVNIAGEREIKLFQMLISKADCFEIYSTGDEEVKFALMFYNALTRISP